MKIEIEPNERATLNGLIAIRQGELSINLGNCEAINDKEQKKLAVTSVKSQIKDLEALSEKINQLDAAIPNEYWGSK